MNAKSVLTVVSLVAAFPLILLSMDFIPRTYVLEFFDIADILIPIAALPFMFPAVWRSLIARNCDNYDRFLSAVFFMFLGIGIQMVWRLLDRIAGTTTSSRDAAIIYSLALMALGGILQIIVLDNNRGTSIRATSAKLLILLFLTALASIISMRLTHLG